MSIPSLGQRRLRERRTVGDAVACASRSCSSDALAAMLSMSSQICSKSFMMLPIVHIYRAGNSPWGLSYISHFLRSSQSQGKPGYALRFSQCSSWSVIFRHHQTLGQSLSGNQRSNQENFPSLQADNLSRTQSWHTSPSHGGPSLKHSHISDLIIYRATLNI